MSAPEVEGLDFGFFIPGGTKFHVNEWLKITHDPFIINAIKGTKIELTLFLKTKLNQESFVGQKQTLNTDNLVQELLKKGIIEECSDDPDQVISNIFIRPKPNGKYRLILDLSEMNKNVTYKHFKMTSLQTALELINREDFMTSLDLSDAYYSIPIAAEDRKYLRFKWSQKLYQYTCMPNGLAQAPRYFTRILKAVFAHLQKLGIPCFGYIDDTFIKGETYEECENNMKTMLQLLVKLGFKIHPTKSTLKPTKIMTFLGYSINSKTMLVSPIQEN